MDDIVPDDDADAAGELPVHAAIVPRQRRVEAFASDGESLLYSSTRDQASALNRTATEIWELCDGTRTIGAITRALSQRYGIDEAHLLADVTAAVTTLRARGLVDVSRDAGDDVR
jgi:pyrroloquinoline quinone biosynthesis protein D